MRRLVLAGVVAVMTICGMSGSAMAAEKGASGATAIGGTHRSMEYARNGSRSMQLDLYIPDGRGPFPTIVFFHGGGWLTGSRADVQAAAGRAAYSQVARGYAVASVSYTLSTVEKWPQQAYDVKAAIRFLRANAGKYNLDKTRFASWGVSAGGHLAAIVGTSGGVAALEDLSMGNRQESSQVQAAIDFYGPTDFSKIPPDLARKFGGEWLLIDCPFTRGRNPIPTCPRSKIESANPASYVDKHDPPHLIVHGTNDRRVHVGQSQLLADALTAAGVENKLVLIKGGPHGGGTYATGIALAEAEAFIDDKLGGGSLSGTDGSGRDLSHGNTIHRIDNVRITANGTGPTAGLLGQTIPADELGPGWEHSYKTGVTDRNGRYMGGSTIVHIVGHKGKLFAGNSYWHDSRNIWYGGKDRSTGWAQVLRLDKPGGKWEVDLELGPQHLRVEALKSLTFTTDGEGRQLRKPVNLLAAAEYNPGPHRVDIDFFSRNDQTGRWEKSTVHSGPRPENLNDRSCRAMRVYRDKVTGVDRVFLSVGKLGLISGVHDPRVAGKVRWDPEPESGPVETRVLAIIEANGSLLFTAGRKIYRRNDGAEPTYTLVHDVSDLHPDHVSQPIGGIRGLSPIPSSDGRGQSLLFALAEGTRARGGIYRLDPTPDGRFKRTREVYIDTLMSRYLKGNPVYFILAAYNDIYPVVDPLTGETVHLIGFESWIGGNRFHMWGFDPKKNGGFYAGGMYAIRDSKGNYRLREINGPARPSKPPLVATCVFAVSPFGEDHGGAIYFGGHDGNHRESTNHAWIFRTSLRNALHDHVHGNQ